MDVFNCLSDLSMASGPSGREGAFLAELTTSEGRAQTVLGHAMTWMESLHASDGRPFFSSVSVDGFGNLVGFRPCGKPDARRVVLDAHLDEVGLVITGAEEGFLTFRSVGGVDPRMLPDREVTLLTEPPCFGLIAVLPPHVQKPGDADKSIPLTDLRIDAGLTQAQAEKLTGTFAVPRGTVRSLLNQTISGKAMDDRAGFVTLLRAAELLKDASLDVDLYIMGSSREETGGEGALTGAFSLKPDCFIAVDVTHARTPDASKEETFPAGSGAIVGIGPNIARWMSDRLIAKAEEKHIPWLPEVMAGNTGTNAWRVQTAREGIATAVLSLPLKYMHSPVETLDLNDLESCAALLAAFVTDLAKEGGDFLAD